MEMYDILLAKALGGGSGGGGGGGSSYTLLAEADLENISTTSTSASTVGNIYNVEGAYNYKKIIYVKIRDKAGVRNGYFYGMDSYFTNVTDANGGTTTVTSGIHTIYRKTEDTLKWVTYFYASNPYGIFASHIRTNGQITIAARYNSNYTGTIDGDYHVEVYALDWPGNGSPFDGK